MVSLPNHGSADPAVLRRAEDGDSGRTLLVLSKADLVGADRLPAARDAVAVSALTGQGIDMLTGLLADAARTRIGADEAPALTQERHRHHLEQCAASLRAGLAQRAGATELGAEDLRRAADALGRVTGAVDVEAVLDAVFGRFCIGK